MLAPGNFGAGHRAWHNGCCLCSARCRCHGGAMMKTSAKCVVCHGYTQYRCAGCGLSFYCTPQHQRQDWPSHRAECLASQGDPQGRRTRKLRRVVPLSPVAKDSSEGAGEQGADAGLLERTPDGRQVQLDPDALEALLTSGIPLADARRALAKFGGEDSGSAWEWLQDGHARGTVEVHDFALETEGMLDDIGHSEVEMLLREHRGPADMPPDQCSTAAAGAANQRRPSTPPGAIVSLIAMMPDPMLRLVYDCNVTCVVAPAVSHVTMRSASHRRGSGVQH